MCRWSVRTRPGLLFLFVPLMAVPLLAGSLQAQFTDEDCSVCHLGDDEVPQVPPDALAGSIHEGMGCTDCHEGLTDLPHEESLPAVNCGLCHDTADEVYQVHGLGVVGESPMVPTCAQCHGAHDILPISHEDSRVHPHNLAETCASCHEDEHFTEETGVRFKHPVQVYRKSVHGRAVSGGRYFAATCNDCHSTGGSAHRILPPGDIESTINHFNIPKTCGKCHEGVKRDYWEGIHGELTRRGQTDAPTCTGCHGEHNILPKDDPRSPVSPIRLAEATCSPCHESAALNEKYEVPTGRLQSFRDSYHGLKSKAGDVTVANCASCHGAHRILPSTDPTSTIHPANLVATCGSCHPGISPAIAQTPIHETSTGHETGAAAVVKKIYIIAIIVIIGSMILHWLIDLGYQIHKTMTEKPQVRRMDPDEVAQHTMLALSFTVLVITGFSLRFYDAWWAERLFGWDGGFSFRGTVHRFAGVILLMASLWHVLYILTARGRRFIKDMSPRPHDFTQFFQTIRFNLRLSSNHPQFERFSYVEKAEYWALVWGTVVMGVTGLILWFDNIAVNWMPKGVLDVMLIIHYYEAWLAFLAILIWHMYSTVFSPKVYPMNPSWITGTMPKEMHDHEHPLADAPLADGPNGARYRVEGSRASAGGSDAEAPGKGGGSAGAAAEGDGSEVNGEGTKGDAGGPAGKQPGKPDPDSPQR